MKAFVQVVDRYKVNANPLFSERRVELVAVVLTSLLLLQLLYSALRLSVLSEPESIAPASDVMAVSDRMAVEVVSAELSEELRARPLFWSSRRVQVSEPVASSQVKTAAASKSKLDKIKLVGIFGGGESAGIIALVNGNKRRILLGESVEGWSLDSVARNEVVFADGARRETLILQTQKYIVTPVAAGSGGSVSGQGGGSVADPGAVPAAANGKAAKRSLGLGFGGRGKK
jgi:hypothetical protein